MQARQRGDLGEDPTIWGNLGNALKRGGKRVQQGYNQWIAEESAQQAMDTNRSFGEILKNVDNPPAGMPSLYDPLEVLMAGERWATSRLFGGAKDIAKQRFANVGEAQKDIQNLPMSKTARSFMDNVQNADGVLNKLSTAASDPAGMGAFGVEVGVEFLPQLLAAAGVTAATGPGGGALVMGGLSGLTERYSSPAEFLNGLGIDLTDPAQLDALLANPEAMQAAQSYGFTRGTIIGTFDALSGGLAGKSLAKSPLANMLLQMPAQAALGGGGEAAAQLATTGKIDPTEVILEAIGELATAPVEVLGVGGQMYSNARDQRIKAVQAKQNADNLGELLDTAKGSKLRTDDPQAFAEHLQNLTEGKDEILIDAKPVMEFLQSSGEDPLVFFDSLGVTPESLTEAVATGGDVAVKTGAYVGMMADHQYRDAVLTHTREDIGAMTLAEAEIAAAESQADTTQAVNDAQANEKARRTAQDPADRIFDLVNRKLREAGTYDAEGARAAAELFRQHALTLSEAYAKEGKQFDVGAFFDSYGLDIRRGDTETQVTPPLSDAQPLEDGAPVTDPLGAANDLPDVVEIDPTSDFIAHDGTGVVIETNNYDGIVRKFVRLILPPPVATRDEFDNDSDFAKYQKNVAEIEAQRENGRKIIEGLQADQQNKQPQDSGTLYQFAGPNAQTADTLTLTRAKALEGQGFDAETIRQATGWHRGKDNKWRFEIDDSQATVSDAALDGISPFDGKIDSVPLGDVLDHPALYEAYPFLKDVPVAASLKKDETFSAQLNLDTGVISLGRGYWTDALQNKRRSSLLHEIQHLIQNNEGFASGANKADPNYSTNAGEAEARLTQARANLSGDQRLSTLFQSKPVATLSGDEIPGLVDGDVSASQRAAKAWYKNNLRGREIESVIGAVRFSNKGTKAINSNPDTSTLRLLPAIEGIISSGEYVGNKPAINRKDGIVKFHRFEGDVALGDEVVRTAILVGEDDRGNLFYDLGKTLPPNVPGKDSPGVERQSLGTPRKDSLGSEGKAGPSFDQTETPVAGGLNPQVNEAIKSQGPGSAGEGKTSLDQSIANNDPNFNIELLDKASTGIKRGSITFADGETVVRLFKDADPSTFLHETGHLFLKMMADISQSENVPQSIADDFQTTLNWLGVETAQDLDPATGGQAAVDAHEKWARGFEEYLKSGKAPSVELQNSFARFKAWLMRVYTRLRGAGVEINNEISGVFDRMLASEEQINTAEAQNAFAVSPAMADLLTDGETQALGQAARHAHDEAVAEVTQKRIRLERRETTKWWKEESAKVRSQVEDEVYSQPIYKAWHVLTKGEYRDGATPDILKGAKLSLPALTEFHGPGVRKLIPGAVPPVATNKGTLTPEMAAEAFGFDGPDAFMHALLNMERPKQKIDAEVGRIMKERHGDPLNDGSLEVAAQDAVHSDQRGIFIRGELRALARKAKKQDTPADVINAIVDRVFIDKPVGELLKPMRYLQQSIRAAKASEKALLAEDFDMAFQKKREQLLNHALFRRAFKAKDEVGKINKYLRKLQVKAINPKTVDPEYVARVKDVLEAYSFGAGLSDRKRAALMLDATREWMKAKQDNGDSQLVIPPRILEADNLTHWRDMTLEDLKGLRDVVKSLMKAGRENSQEAKDAQQKLANEAADAIAGNTKATRIEPLERSWWQKAGAFGRLAFAEHRKMESLILELDGYGTQGTVYKSTFQKIKQADDRYIDRSMQAGKALNDILGTYTAKEKLQFFKKTFIPELNQSLSLSARLAFALNMGNAGNVEAMNNEYSEAQINAVLKTLTNKDWDVVEGIWEHVDTYWKDLSALEKRTTGVEPGKVDALAFTTPSGRKIKGGYYPLVGDPHRSDTAKRDLEDRQSLNGFMAGGHAKATTKHGSTIERNGFGRDRKVPGARTAARATSVIDKDGTGDLDTFEGWWRLLVQGPKKK